VPNWPMRRDAFPRALIKGANRASFENGIRVTGEKIDKLSNEADDLDIQDKIQS
jgi:hypothetical protein